MDKIVENVEFYDIFNTHHTGIPIDKPTEKRYTQDKKSLSMVNWLRYGFQECSRQLNTLILHFRY